ncbi:MAG: hypothetical protein AB4063_06985 [Crocosphaera sp.]
MTKKQKNANMKLSFLISLKNISKMKGRQISIEIASAEIQPFAKGEKDEVY